MVKRLALGCCLLLAACDAVELPADRLVVEAFAEPGASLPEVTVRRTAELDAEEPARPVEEALVTLAVEGVRFPYEAVPGAPGRYRPASERVLAPGERIAVEVVADLGRADAVSAVPARIAIDSMRITPSPVPVAAVFADSLGLSLDEGFLYSVDAELFWTVPEADTAWVRARIRPPAAFPSAVVDFVLATERIEEEVTFDTDGMVRSWRGTYAVPVAAEDDVLPPHEIELALVRSGEDYARYALSRTTPDRREPVGNVRGGLGIVAGLSIDRRLVAVE